MDDYQADNKDGGLHLPKVKSKWHALQILWLPVLLSYLDIYTDLETAVTYYNADHVVWGTLGLVFALLPGFIVAILFLPGVSVAGRLMAVLQLSVLVEALNTAKEKAYSRTLALVRVVEPLFEAVPQLLLQLHAILVLWREDSPSSNPLEVPFRSVLTSAASLAYAATDVSSLEGLIAAVRPDENAYNWCSRCSRPSCCWPECCPWSVTKIVFGRAPTKGKLELMYLGAMHPQTHVWFCFVYHVLEVVSRFIPLAFLILLTRSAFIGVLVYLWLSRCALVGWMAWQPHGRKSRLNAARDEFSDLRFRVRVVAMPFLDSLIGDPAAFAVGLSLTLLEFVVIAVFYHFYPSSELASYERRGFSIIAAACLAGKMLLALLVIMPLKRVAATIAQSDEKAKRGKIAAAKQMAAALHV